MSIKLNVIFFLAVSLLTQKAIWSSSRECNGDEYQVNRSNYLHGSDEEALIINLAKDKSGRTPLFVASLDTNIELVSFLLENGADPNIPDNRGKLPITEAIRDGHIEMARELLPYVDVNLPDSSQRNSLHMIADYNHGREFIEELIKRGLDPDFIRRDGRREETALMIAIRRKNTGVAKDIAFHSDPNIAKSNGTMALHEAVNHKIFEVIPVLLQRGADPNGRSGKSTIDTPLYMAADKGYIKAVEFLLQGEGMDIDARNGRRGRTALFVAASKGYIDIVELLLENGANRAIASKTFFGRAGGNTPEQEAREKGYDDIADIIRSFRR